MLSVLTLLLACASKKDPAAVSAAVAKPTTTVERLPFPALRDVACMPAVASPPPGADGSSSARAHVAGPACFALTASGLVPLRDAFAPMSLPADVSAAVVTAEGLAIADGTLMLLGNCPEGPCARPLTLEPASVGAHVPQPALPPVTEADMSLADAAALFTDTHNRAVAAGWRTGFHRVVVAPGGALIVWTRGLDEAGQLSRTSPGRATVRLPSPRAAVSYPAWLAMHPTGSEAYLLPWPSSVLTAFDPVSLVTRWALPLEGAAHPLFIDAGGRLLLAGVGTSDTDRWTDWPLRDGRGAVADPARDESLRAAERPSTDSVVVVDLDIGESIARARGAFRRWLALPDGRFLLATDREVVFFQAPPLQEPR